VTESVPSRRAFLQLAGAAVAGLAGVAGPASGAHGDDVPDHVTVEYDRETIRDYQPQLVVEGVEPQPIAFYGLHATSEEFSTNVVAGFTKYPYQSGLTSRDSHLGDHEPVYVFYDETSGEITRVLFSAYHWFKGVATGDQLQIADPHRPILEVHPEYHHYLIYAGAGTGTLIETGDLLGEIDGWLANGMESELALSQPHDPYAMRGRETWWRHSTGNYVDAFLRSLWFNAGLGPRASVSEVSTW
jgi:hypothetical protein